MAKKAELTRREEEALEELTRHVRSVLVNQWVNTRDMSLRAFAARANLSEMTVRNFMNWKTRRPHLQTLIQLAHALGLRIAVLPAGARIQPEEIRVDQGVGLKPRRRRRR